MTSDTKRAEQLEAEQISIALGQMYPESLEVPFSFRLAEQGGHMTTRGPHLMGKPTYHVRYLHDPQRESLLSKAETESQATIQSIKDDIAELKTKVDRALGAAQECLRRIDTLGEQVGGRIGLGAIHSLNEGKVNLSRPIFVGYESSDGEVMASVDELKAYGVGRTRAAALKEVQDELWYLYQDLISTPYEEIGDGLRRVLTTLESKIDSNVLDA